MYYIHIYIDLAKVLLAIAEILRLIFLIWIKCKKR